MDDPLQRFREVMLISALTSLGLALLLGFLTTWRERWLRLVSLEETIWKRIGINERWLSTLRRVEENRLVVPAVAILLALHVLLLVFSSGSYFYFKRKLEQRDARKSSLLHTPRPPPAAERIR